ncbi:MAG: hypothetical protein A2622_13180 [Bdellovibrionales bacterium RIFCSPHIGHO2_01_FULL_40_29]|nr:MAG: hypothetical protein A2622_13180 [Bdellovibrionales bacterium RIFCSPHIGHO2_01_FULL_40_29]OFZ33358.1 MAG: hypothetical protein A3D17_13705 [Bdellovibrionales bacterium RIFCSPHIGHO2_02_FULL_40_15]
MNSAFDSYFEKIYTDRWPAIRRALVEKNKQISRPNKFAELDSGLSQNYVMDPASQVVARALEVMPTDVVLDMCSAPGGKTLVLAEEMSFNFSNQWQLPSGELIANEMSEGRRARLMRVLNEHINREKRLFIHVKGLDGNQYGLRQPEVFDRVLADVPCSGERHLMENPSEMKLWSEKRTKNLSVRQYSLLSSAWLAVKVGGRIVYSTCSISPLENDSVVAKLLKKRKPQILRPAFLNELDFLEKTEHGYQVLPDRCGFGPMYFSVIEKT